MTEDQQTIDDLTRLLTRLIRAVLNGAPTDDICEKAMDYLTRKGFVVKLMR